MKNVQVGNINLNNNAPMAVIGGMNVIENKDTAKRTIEAFKEACQILNIPYIAKFSWSKRNRSSVKSFDGVSLDEGILFFEDIKKEFDVPILTDVHLPEEVTPIASVCDFLQLPAFLARQRDIIQALAETNLPINIKKPQFMPPDQVGNIYEKFNHFNNTELVFCERGTMFGYESLIVDMLGINIMKNETHNSPIMFDLTHSLQARKSGGIASEGRRSQMVNLGKAAISCGISSIFIEAHPNPDKALCDGPSALPIDKIYPLLAQYKEIDDLVKSQPTIVIE